MNVCLYYQPDAYTTNGPRLMGRNAAGESFLNGFLEHASYSELWIQINNLQHVDTFIETANDYKKDIPLKTVTRSNLKDLSQVGLLYIPGPTIGEEAKFRSFYGSEQWSLCGVTHTTSSSGAMDALVDILTAPVQSWDALICTSTAVKDNVMRLLQAQLDYLSERFGVTKYTLPLMPVIPLGIKAAEFEFSEQEKYEAKRSLGIKKDEIAILYAGRLSFHAKAHPLAMYQMLELAANKTNKELVLIECGWHANEYIKDAYTEAANRVCPSVKVIRLDGRLKQNRNLAWASADIFCSFSDNIQETFGITPVEAMASGLPVIVSDWDGYKDTVREGIDGFRIPTLMPPDGLGRDIALRHALEIDTYDKYCGYASSLVAVDIDLAVIRFIELLSSAELRRRMGALGKERAKNIFDWNVVIKQYENLWSEQEEIRNLNRKTVNKLSHPWPARMDPFHSFEKYPTEILSTKTELLLNAATSFEGWEKYRKIKKLKMVDFAELIMPSDKEVQTIITSLEQRALRVENILKPFTQERQPLVFRSLVWLLKLGVLRQKS